MKELKDGQMGAIAIQLHPKEDTNRNLEGSYIYVEENN